MANSAGVELIAGDFGKWQAVGHLGQMLKAMRRDFTAACDAAPAVLLIDEIDAVCNRTEDSGRSRSYVHQVVAAFLTLSGSLPEDALADLALAATGLSAAPPRSGLSDPPAGTAGR